MKYKFGYIPSFAKELKTLCKKYKSLKKDFEALKEEIETNPNIGVSLEEGLRKIRLNISSKNKGKSGGARVITHEILVEIDHQETMSVAFISIYDKSEYDTVDLDIVKKLVEEYRGEE
ncbi:toxin [Capnocytophaga ochracea]